jgi:hypothetical protein
MAYLRRNSGQPFFPARAAGKVHENQEKRSEQEKIEVDIEASEEKQDQPEDARHFGKDERDKCGPLEPVKGGLVVLVRGFPEQNRTEDANEDNGHDGQAENGIAEVLEIGDGHESVERPETGPDELGDAEINEEACDNGHGDERNGLEVPLEFIPVDHGSLLLTGVRAGGRAEADYM